MFPPRGFADDAAVRPPQLAEVHGQRNPGQARCRRRAASLADGNLVVDVEGKRRHRLARLLQNFTIGGQDEMVLDAGRRFPGRGRRP